MTTQTPENEEAASRRDRVGVWLIGARGGLATTAIFGARLIAARLAPATGLLGEREPFREMPGLPRLDDLVFGGHEIRQGSLEASIQQIAADTGSLDAHKIGLVREELEAADREIVTGTAQGCGPAIEQLGGGDRSPLPARQHVARLRADLEAFRERHALRRLVVVNLASTEPALDPDAAWDRASFEEALDAPDGGGLPASSLYSRAALEAGAAFINFTPSPGSLLPALIEEATERGLPVVGDDGKSGETLVKSALARMFVIRNLRVLSWQGYNILGDRDGEILADEANKRSKLETKDSVLRSILGYDLHTKVGIDYVPSLSDLKTAWDFIHFEGFLGFKMSLQFTWQGCDAILAAPLVLDLARFMAVCLDRDRAGLQPQFAGYFKRPRGVEEHDLAKQFDLLEAWAKS